MIYLISAVVHVGDHWETWEACFEEPIEHTGIARVMGLMRDALVAGRLNAGFTGQVCGCYLETYQLRGGVDHMEISAIMVKARASLGKWSKTIDPPIAAVRDLASRDGAASRHGRN